MKGKSIKSSCLILLVITLILSCSNIIYAEVTSDYQTVTVNGYTYNFRAYANNDEDEVWGSINSYFSAAVPVGYVGGNARLYDSNDVLVTTSGWVYNKRSISSFWCDTPSYYKNGFYYSYSKVRYYNGQGYSEYSTYQSPFIYCNGQEYSINSTSTITSIKDSGYNSNESNAISDRIKSGYKVNKKGEKYGFSGRNATRIGSEPDLIAAYGSDGTFGYVRATELESEKPNTPKEAVSEQVNRNGRSINLYDKDGETIIGTFQIGVE